MRESKKRAIYKREQSEAVGVSIKQTTAYKTAFKKLKVIKITLLALIVVFYFMYSQALLFLVVGYALLYFYARKIEKNANKNMPSRLHISILKFDSVIAMALIVVAVVSVVVIQTSSSSKNSMFSGKNEDEIRTHMEERGMKSSEIDTILKRMQENNDSKSKGSVTTNLFTLCCGEWKFFKLESKSSIMASGMPGGAKMIIRRDGDGNGAFAFNGEIPEGFQIPEGATLIKMGGTRKGAMGFAKEIPFAQTFSQAMMAIDSIMLFAILGIGLLSMKIRPKKS